MYLCMIPFGDGCMILTHTCMYIFSFDDHITSHAEYDQMKEIRQSAIQHAAAAVAVGPTTTATFGIILGTLGRQGNPAIVQRIQRVLHRAGVRHFVLLLSEITPAKLQLLKVNCWVQVACPRLSVDWGHCLSSSSTPVLSPYELFVCLEETVWRDSYPMDYYSASGGPWTNYYDTNKDRQLKREQPPQSSADVSTSPKDDEDDTV
jgi:2-(3-amino-3-carboxypropyl)histidine synthase